MLDDISYAMAFRQNLTNVLRIDDKYITNGSFHAAGLGYVSWLETNTNLGAPAAPGLPHRRLVLLQQAHILLNGRYACLREQRGSQ